MSNKQKWVVYYDLDKAGHGGMRTTIEAESESDAAYRAKRDNKRRVISRVVPA